MRLFFQRSFHCANSSTQRRAHESAPPKQPRHFSSAVANPTPSTGQISFGKFARADETLGAFLFMVRLSILAMSNLFNAVKTGTDHIRRLRWNSACLFPYICTNRRARCYGRRNQLFSFVVQRISLLKLNAFHDASDFSNPQQET